MRPSTSRKPLPEDPATTDDSVDASVDNVITIVCPGVIVSSNIIYTYISIAPSILRAVDTVLVAH